MDSSLKSGASQQPQPQQPQHQQQHQQPAFRNVTEEEKILQKWIQEGKLLRLKALY